MKKKEIIALDTNIMLRCILDEDTEQSKVALLLIENDSYKFYISVQVFVELEYALIHHYEYKRENVVKSIEYILSMKKIVFIKDSIRKVLFETLEIYKKKNTLSFVDCLLFFEAKKIAGCTLYTFDKKLAGLDGVRLLI